MLLDPMSMESRHAKSKHLANSFRRNDLLESQKCKSAAKIRPIDEQDIRDRQLLLRRKRKK